MTTAKLLKRAETVRARLRARLDTLPPPDDAPTMRIRDAILEEAMNLRSLSGHVSNHAQRVEKPKTPAHDLEPLVAWRGMLTKAQEHFESQLSALDQLPLNEQNRRSAELFSLRAAIGVIVHGVSEEGESAVLSQWLRERGVAPVWGERHVFAGRGGLRAIGKRISYIESRLAGC